VSYFGESILISSGVDQFKQEFARLEEHNDDEEEHNSPPHQRKYTSLPRWVTTSWNWTIM